jgi:hypothetical protein
MSFDIKLANGDIKPQQNGDLGLVDNKEKLIQDVLKMLFTATGENKVHPWYGTPLLSRVVGTAWDLDILQSEIQTAVQYGLNNIKTLQQLQQADSQFLTPQEILSQIVLIDAQRDEVDPRKLVLTVQLTARSNDLITESFVVSV